MVWATVYMMRVNGYSEDCTVSRVVHYIYDLGAGGGEKRRKRRRDELENLLVIKDYLD